MGDSPHAVQPPPFPARLDHLLVGTPDVESTTESFARRFGVRPATGGRHRAWSTRNALLSLGPRTYLEVIGPDERPDPGSGPLLPWIARMRTARLGTWAAASTDVETDVRRAAAAGVDLGVPFAASRRRDDGTEIAWRMSDPAADRLGGVVPFVIDWGASPHPGGATPRGVTLVSLRAEHPEPDRVREALAAMGIAMHVESGPEPALVALFQSPEGRLQLR